MYNDINIKFFNKNFIDINLNFDKILNKLNDIT